VSQSRRTWFGVVILPRRLIELLQEEELWGRKQAGIQPTRVRSAQVTYFVSMRQLHKVGVGNISIVSRIGVYRRSVGAPLDESILAQRLERAENA
jgi:hypothetical protein